MVWYMAVLYGWWPYNYKFGFLLQTKGNLLRVDGGLYDVRERIWD